MKVCAQIPFGRCLCFVETSQLIYKAKIDWLTSVWFKVLLGYFPTDYCTVIFSKAAIAKCPFVFLPLVISFLVVCRPLVLLKSSSVHVFILFVCTYSAGAYFADFFCFMSFLLLIDLYPLDTLT